MFAIHTLMVSMMDSGAFMSLCDTELQHCPLHSLSYLFDVVVICLNKEHRPYLFFLPALQTSI